MNTTSGSTALVSSRWFRYAAAVYLALIVVATAHFAEHILQIFQFYVWHVKPWGLIGQVADREWLHVWYNLPFYLIMFSLYLAVRKKAPEAFPHDKGMKTLAVFLWIQGYHLLEHVVKIYQYVTTGIEPAPGILGSVVGLVPLHFFLVLVTYVLTVMVFFQSPLIGYRATMKSGK